jgi:anthranilate synthase component 2
MAVLVIDNYDSFTYNLVQYLAELGAEPDVRRNDQVSVAEVAALAPEAIVISPGPGRPEDAGVCVELVRRVGPRIPILGVCLGHQAIGVAYGAAVELAPRLMHGKTSLVHHRGGALYAGVPNPFVATRYHSLCVCRDGLPGELEVTAECLEDGVIMGLRHRRHPVEGVQFHPESILTGFGRRLLANFLGSAGLPVRDLPAPPAPAGGVAGDALGAG